MKHLLLCLVVLFTLASTQSVFAASAAKKAKKAAKKEGSRGGLAHVVALKFKEGATQAQIDEVVKAFEALPGKIPQIASLDWGTNVSPEKHDKGFTHCFTLTFRTEKDRDEYLVHPDHKEFGKILGPVLGDVFVLDYWAKK
jgi:hypothetical protein